MFSRALLCVALAAACSPALADTVWMKNGDRLSGKIKVFDGGKLLLETPYGGSIALDWKQVKTLESDQELLVKQDAYTCLLYTSPSPRDRTRSRMPSSA